MEDRQLAIETNLVDLEANQWLGQIDEICDDHGFFEQLGRNHCAGFLEAGNHLLVTFENVEKVRAYNVDAEPRGFAYARHDGWSHLALLSFGESWFRDKPVYDFFDRLVDDGFFEDFQRIVFHGGDGGTAYAAAAFSVAAPGATVIALRPQATLASDTTGWDDRYKSQRQFSFSDRYGYAPEMVDAAEHVFVAYDPYVQLDACHAALFRKQHVTRVPCPLMGDNLDRTFDRMGIHDVLIKLAMDGALDRKRFKQLLRARRYDQTYAADLVNYLIGAKHHVLAKAICAYMMNRGRGNYFKKKLADIARLTEA